MVKIQKCSFCGAPADDDMPLLEGTEGGTTHYICLKCAKIGVKALEQSGKKLGLNGNNIMKPSEIKARLDEYVIGQEEAKKTLAVAAYNHYKRIFDCSDPDVEVQKSNVLMLGPTGSGKTYLAKTLARILNVPFVVADATSMTEAGYVGEDVESMIAMLVENAGGDVKKAEYGIVYLDEIDKICSGSQGDNVKYIGKDPSHTGVQQALLKLFEGSTAKVCAGRMGGTITVNTENILFICGGAFSGLEDIVKERLKEERTKGASIGFNQMVLDKKEDDRSLSKVFAEAETSDFQKYGLIPELYGRLPITICLDDLDEASLVRILKEPKSSLTKQYQKLFSYDKVELIFDDKALSEIAKIAIKRKTGARGLRSIVERSMKDLMYSLPDRNDISTVMITDDVIKGTGEPIYQTRRKVINAQ